MATSQWITPATLKNRQQIAKLLAKYGPADETLDAIERIVGSAVGAILNHPDVQTSADIRDDADELVAALETIERILAKPTGAVRALFVSEAASIGMLPQVMALEDAVRGSHGMLAQIAKKVSDETAKPAKRGPAFNGETSTRRWLVERIANITRQHGLEWSRSGDFANLIEMVWESTFPAQDADRDIRDAMSLWR